MESLFENEVASRVGRMLIVRGETLAIAESVTGGLLQAAFASVQDASCFLQGGITAYNLGQKCRHLSVEPIHAEKCNCVSETTATQMALNVCTMFSSHWGVAITGYATPVNESGNQVFAFYSIVCKGEIVDNGRIDPPEGKAIDAQLWYVQHLVDEMRRFLDAAP